MVRKIFFEILVLLSSRRMIERLPAFSGIRNRRRPDRVLACQFNRSFAYLGSASAHQPFRWLLEDVFDCYSTRRNRLPAGVFPQPHCDIPRYLSARRARRPHSTPPPSLLYH